MATKLNLYLNCEITRERNAKVDSIETYLTSVATTTQTQTGWPKAGKDIQYQQIDLHKKLKVDLSQVQVGSRVFNYAKIYQDDKAYYYFIDKANWKSTNTIEFDMTLDTINTFAGDFTLNKKTRITRQHRDRIETVSYIEEGFAPYDEFHRNYLPKYAYLDYNGQWEVWEHDTYSIDTTGLLGAASAITLSLINSEGTVLNSWPGESALVKEIGRRWNEDDSVYEFYMLYTSHGEDNEFVLEWADIQSNMNSGEYYVFTTVPSGAFQRNWTFGDDWAQMIGGRYIFTYKRLIDQKDENINPPQFKTFESKINDFNSNTQWYLAYVSDSTSEGSPVNTILIPEDKISVKIKQNGSITASDLADNTYYYAMAYWQCSFQYTIGSVIGTRKFPNGNQYDTYLYNASGTQVGRITNQPAPPAGKDHQESEDPSTYFVKFYKSGSDIVVITYKFWRDFWGWLETSKVETYTVSSIKFVNDGPSTGYRLKYYTSTTDYNSGNDIYDNLNSMSSGSFTESLYSSGTLNSLNELDRTDNKILKLIDIPYSIFQVNDGDFVNSPDWHIDHSKLKTVGNTDFYALIWDSNNKQKFETTILIPENPAKQLFIDPDDTAEALPNKTGTKYSAQTRLKANESKLYSSEFYSPKFVYDSFNYQFQLENIDTTGWKVLPENKVDYKVANTANSRFLFHFNYPLKRTTSDYDSICVVDRNNEMLLYNSSYLDYIRNGYNYDIKNKQANLEKNIATTAVSTIGSAAAIGIGAAVAAGAGGGSAAGPIGAAIGAAVGLVGGLINLSYQQSQADRNIAQKLDEARRQAVSVSGADDIDLLNYYTDGNKAKYVLYEASDRVRNTVNDLFYYCGYNDDIQAVPNENTRLWFNFIQCDPVFNETWVEGIPITTKRNKTYHDFEEDIRERYKEGITVYHYRGDKCTNSYDWAQTQENWEISVLHQIHPDDF